MPHRMKAASARRSRVAHTGIVAMTGALIGVSIWIGWSKIDFGQILSRDSQQAAVSHVGAIVFNINPESCESVSFDNDSGRFVGGAKTCDERVALGADGKPVPLGTLQHMQAIKNFFQR
jgi:hypothetical protein